MGLHGPTQLQACEEPHNGDRSRSIDWYAQGVERVVTLAGVRLTVRLVERKGRRARIAIMASSVSDGR